MALSAALATSGAIIAAFVTAVWLLSLRLRDSSIADTCWGLGFLVTAWSLALLNGGPPGSRAWLILALVTAWGLRLSGHILVRNWGRGEDFRYRRWREAAGSSWWWRSYAKVFLLQGAVMWVVAMPLVAALTSPAHERPDGDARARPDLDMVALPQSGIEARPAPQSRPASGIETVRASSAGSRDPGALPGPNGDSHPVSGGQGPVATAPSLGWLDALGTAVWLVGFLFEAIGDWQLTRFKARPEHRGRLMTSGLWRYTRHPNYFGDATVWWGHFLVTAAGGAWWTAMSPVVMTVLLVRVSGVSMLEATLADTKPGYREYMETTSAFLPRPPRRARH